MGLSTDLTANRAPAGREGKSDKGTHTFFPDGSCHVRKTLCRSVLQGMSRDGPWVLKRRTEVLGQACGECGPTRRHRRSSHAYAERADSPHLHLVAMASASR